MNIEDIYWTILLLSIALMMVGASLIFLGVSITILKGY